MNMREYYYNGQLPFSCMLAYIPGLFWVPLLIGCHDYRHRRCASMGIWLTVIAVQGYFCIPEAIGALSSWGFFDWMNLASFYSGWTAENWYLNLRALALFHLVLLPLGLYVPVNSLTGFFKGTMSAMPFNIPFFGNLQLLPLGKEAYHGEQA